MANRHFLILVGTVATVAGVVTLFVFLFGMIGTENNGIFASKPNTPINQIDRLAIHDLEPVINVTRSSDDS